MSQNFDLLNCILLFMYPSDVVLLFLTGVGGWVCCMASNIVRRGRQNCAFTKIPPVSASAVEETTYLRVLHSTCIGEFSFSDLVLKRRTCDAAPSFRKH